MQGQNFSWLTDKCSCWCQVIYTNSSSLYFTQFRWLNVKSITVETHQSVRQSTTEHTGYTKQIHSCTFTSVGSALMDYCPWIQPTMNQKYLKKKCHLYWTCTDFFPLSLFPMQYSVTATYTALPLYYQL